MQCLNLKITYDCTNNCSFCFSKYMKDRYISLNEQKEAVVKGRNKGCDELVLSGGEPTLYPIYIEELIKIAKTIGYKKIIIQTNGYGIAQSKKLVSFLNGISKDMEVCISFSVHSYREDIHNEISGNINAYKYLLKAINEIGNTSCKIYTNTVVNLLNYKRLNEIAMFLNKFNPQVMQFSIMHIKENNSLKISFKDAIKAIRELVSIVNVEVLKTEGIPYCLLYGMEQCVGESAWPNILDLYNEANNYVSDFKQLDCGMRKKMINCNECIMDSICMGVWNETYKEFLNMNIHPIR